MRRIAIIGFGPTYNERPHDWETWGLPWDGHAPQYDRLFEMHDPSLWRGNEKHVARLRELDMPIWMQEIQDDFPSVAYPLWSVVSMTGDYFGSSIAYMLALAIYEEADEIGLWGVDLHAEDGYDHQRPNLEYLLGFAAGRNITITIPEGSSLMKHRPQHNYNGKAVVFPQRYGYA